MQRCEDVRGDSRRTGRGPPRSRTGRRTRRGQRGAQRRTERGDRMRGTWTIGCNSSFDRLANRPPSGPNVRRQAPPSRPSPAAVSSIERTMTPARSPSSGWARSTSRPAPVAGRDAAGQRCEVTARPPPTGGPRSRRRAARRGRELRRPRAAADLVGGFEHRDRARLGERHRRGQPVRAGADDDCVAHDDQPSRMRSVLPSRGGRRLTAWGPRRGPRRERRRDVIGGVVAVDCGIGDLLEWRRRCSSSGCGSGGRWRSGSVARRPLAHLGTRVDPRDVRARQQGATLGGVGDRRGGGDHRRRRRPEGDAEHVELGAVQPGAAVA